METKLREDILLKERVAKIDDINFEKTFDVGEVATRELDNFDKEVLVNDNISKIHNLQEQREESSVFSIEIQPNEFFDNFEVGKISDKKEKFSIKNKPLFFTFASIAVLLCILFIYNLFVINNLRISATQSTVNVSTIITNGEENNYILFENNSKMNIEYKTPEIQNYEQTNWFDSLCNDMNELFGGSHKT